METWQVQQIKENFYPNLFSPQSLEQRIQFYATPGASIAIINDFKLEWAGVFGVANTESKQALTTETLFQAASISKPVTALAVLKLVEQGQLDLDTDVRAYLTSWQVPWAAKVTLRHLLSHTSGLNVHGFAGYTQESALPTIVQILNGQTPANSATLSLEHPPESTMVYSGGGYTLIQLVLEDVQKKPFAQLMTEIILEPLGMTQSSFLQPQNTAFATGHPQNALPLLGNYHLYPEMAAAGLWTTPTDLAKLGLALLQHQYLAQATLKTMLTPQLPELPNSLSFMGLGFACEQTQANLVFKHNGWNEGFVAQIRFCQDSGQGAVIMLNSNSGFAMLEEFMQTVARVYEWVI